MAIKSYEIYCYIVLHGYIQLHSMTISVITINKFVIEEMGYRRRRHIWKTRFIVKQLLTFDDGAFCQHNVPIIIESNLSRFLYFVYHQVVLWSTWILMQLIRFTYDMYLDNNVESFPQQVWKMVMVLGMFYTKHGALH